jgi:hypothetical protein
VKNLIFVISFLLSFSAFARGGGGASGDDGGQGVLCWRRSGLEVPYDYTVQTLDLYEARALFGRDWGFPKVSANLNPDNYSTPNPNSVLKEKRNRLALILGPTHPFLSMFDRAKVIKLDVSDDDLPVTRDEGSLQTQLLRNCELVQLGVHRELDNSVVINSDYSQFLNEWDIAALVLHEALHSYFVHKKSNLVVRQAIGYIFGTREFQVRNAEIFREMLRTGQSVDPKRFRLP